LENMTESGRKLEMLPIVIDKTIIRTLERKSRKEKYLTIDLKDYWVYLVVEYDCYGSSAYILVTKEDDVSAIEEELEYNATNVVVVPLN